MGQWFHRYAIYKQTEKRILVFTVLFVFSNDQNILTTVYLKETDHQSYLHNKSEHPLFLKIQFRPELRLKWMCSTITAFKDESARLVAWGYKADDMKEKVQQVSNIPREIL